jgi:SAM-dependent methyltransferase
MPPGTPPYPITVTRTHAYMGPTARPAGTETFDTPEARVLNDARLRHLAELELPIRERSVLDVGCGVGHLAQFFVARGCEVLCLDGRADNIARLRELYPGTQARVFDVEHDDWETLHATDVTFSFGLLYHLENPFRVLRNMVRQTKECLILDTIVADHSEPLVLMSEETATSSQALHGIGCRPTPSFVVLALREAGMRHVYAPATPVAHPDFRFMWKNDLSWRRNDKVLRCTFVASQHPISSRRLVELLAP